MNLYSVRPDWRTRGIRVKARSEFEAISDAAHWRDGRLMPFTFGVGLASQRFDWGMRFERAQTFVDVVRIGSVKLTTRKLDWKTSQTPKEGRVVRIYDEGCVYWATIPNGMRLQDAADAFRVGYDFNDYTGEISCEAMLLINGEEVEKLQFTIQNKTL